MGAEIYSLWALGDPLPQWLVDYSSGFGSYFGGLANAGEHMYRRAGFNGECMQQRAIEDEEIFGAALLSLADPAIAKEAFKGATNWASGHKAYLSGRLSAGGATGTITRTGPYGGISLGLVAGMGDALNNIDRGADNPEAVLRGILGDKMPHLPEVPRTRCGCPK